MSNIREGKVKELFEYLTSKKYSQNDKKGEKTSNNEEMSKLEALNILIKYFPENKDIIRLIEIYSKGNPTELNECDEAKTLSHRVFSMLEELVKDDNRFIQYELAELVAPIQKALINDGFELIRNLYGDILNNLEKNQKEM